MTPLGARMPRPTTPSQSINSSCLLKHIRISDRYWSRLKRFSLTQSITGFVFSILLTALWKSMTLYWLPGSTFDLASTPFIVYCWSHAKPCPKYLFSVLSFSRMLAHVPCLDHSCSHNESSGVPNSKIQHLNLKLQCFLYENIIFEEIQYFLCENIMFSTFSNIGPVLSHLIQQRF